MQDLSCVNIISLKQAVLFPRFLQLEVSNCPVYVNCRNIIGCDCVVGSDAVT